MLRDHPGITTHLPQEKQTQETIAGDQGEQASIRQHLSLPFINIITVITILIITFIISLSPSTAP